jgi:ParB family transcriptional regulator, chromosome partitioning protein
MATMKTELFKADPENPRTTYDEDENDRLGDDMQARGVLVLLLVKPDGTIIDGWRRWLAAKRKGIKELPVIIVEKALTATETRGIQIATAIHRADLSGHEKAVGCAKLMSINPRWQLQDLAKFLHLSPGTITKLLSVSKCSVPWQQALAAGRVSTNDCYAASGLPEAEQNALLTQKLAGATRDEIVQAARRKNRKGNSPAVKLTRVKLLLQSGVNIIASGAGLSLDELIESLGQAQSEAKKARSQDQDIKSFQAVMYAKQKKRGV